MSDPATNIKSLVEALLTEDGVRPECNEPMLALETRADRGQLAGWSFYANGQVHMDNVTMDTLDVGDLTANNSLHLNSKEEADLNVNSAATANNATNAYGKTEGNLNANSALVANNATNAYGK